MTLLNISVVGNIVLLIILAYLALDRRNWNNRLEEFRKTVDRIIAGFKETCSLRHNPIDEAIKRIDDNIKRIWDRLEK